MAHRFYQYLAFIHPDSDADLIGLKKNLEAFYAKEENPPAISQVGKTVIIEFNNYQFQILFSDEDYVVEEALEIGDSRSLDWADNNFDNEKLKTSLKRFEVSGDEDIEMEYFNDSLFIVETIAKFKNVTIFNID